MEFLITAFLAVDVFLLLIVCIAYILSNKEVPLIGRQGNIDAWWRVTFMVALWPVTLAVISIALLLKYDNEQSQKRSMERKK